MFICIICCARAWRRSEGKEEREEILIALLSRYFLHPHNVPNSGKGKEGRSPPTSTIPRLRRHGGADSVSSVGGPRRKKRREGKTRAPATELSSVQQPADEKRGKSAASHYSFEFCVKMRAGRGGEEKAYHTLQYLSVTKRGGKKEGGRKKNCSTFFFFSLRCDIGAARKGKGKRKRGRKKKRGRDAGHP